MADFLSLWACLFLLTEIFEAPVAWAILSMGRPKKGRALASALLASVWTHPILFSVSWFMPATQADRFLWILAMELVVVTAEAWWHRRFSGVAWPCALVASLMANGVSFGAGWLLF